MPSVLCRLALLMLLVVPMFPAQAVAEPTATAVETESSQQMHEHLQTLDRRLRGQLLGIAKGRSGVTAEDVERLQRHLRSLELRLRTWEDGAELVSRVRALQPLVDNLERAVENPEAAKRTDPRRALKVEWPAPADRQLKGTPANDDCADATPIGDGTYFGDTSTATADGESCFEGSPDVWFAYTAPRTGRVVVDTFGSGFDTVLSIHTDCPGTIANEIACNDNIFGLQSAISFDAQSGGIYRIRVAGAFGAVGPFTLTVGPGGTIAGTVIDDVTGEPVAGVDLEAWDAEGGFAGSASTGADGSYEIPGLVTGNHFVFTRFARDYLQEIYDDVPCSFTYGCEPFEGTPIAVVAGQTTGGIDFALNRGGSISGTVTDRATGSPPENLIVMIEVFSGSNRVGTTNADSTGDYFLGGLTVGTYSVVARGMEFRDELYDDVACPGGLFVGCEPEDGTPVEVSFDTTTGGIDFALDRLGSISGTVSDSSTGSPISFANVEVFSESGSVVTFGFADSAGFYQVGGLAPGNYFVVSFTIEYFDELFDNLPCETGCDPTTGMPVPVDLNSTTPNIDFALERLGAITGTVTHAVTGEPIPDLDVAVYQDGVSLVGFGTTSVTGTFFAGQLLPTAHTAAAQSFEFADELYDEIPCEGFCDPAEGTPIAVSLNTVTSDIDFTLDRKGVISGRVTHAVTGEPVGGVFVKIYDANGVEVSGGFSGSGTGEYVAPGLDPGVHFAVANGLTFFIDELYDEMPCADGCDPTSGTPIAVSLNAVTGGVDFTVDEKGSISGRVLHAGQPVPDAVVNIYDAAGGLRATLVTGSDGSHIFHSLLPGTYFAAVEHFEFNDELYDNLPCLDGCDPTLGTPILVNANSSVQGIDFDLGYCTPTATSLCLTGDRFRVEAIWEDFENEMGPAFADGLTSDAGTFWFFNPNNIEMVVKILDICDLPENRFWVFAAGLTNVGVELRVTDELTGEVVSYSNPLGVPYEPVLDTQAFATCDAGFRRADSAIVAPSVVESPGLPAKGECQPGATSLCLGGDRFQAEVTWRAPNGDGGPARAVPLTDETGYFYFGGADNVEVVVKVLDACALPSRKFWVFGAGLTNFEVTLTVTDTVSDVVRVYTNDQATNFEAITDTSAFDTCDDG